MFAAGAHSSSSLRESAAASPLSSFRLRPRLPHLSTAPPPSPCCLRSAAPFVYRGVSHAFRFRFFAAGRNTFARAAFFFAAFFFGAARAAFCPPSPASLTRLASAAARFLAAAARAASFRFFSLARAAA